MLIPLSNYKTIAYKFFLCFFYFCLLCVAMGVIGELGHKTPGNGLLILLCDIPLIILTIVAYRYGAGRYYRVSYDDNTLYYTRLLMRRRLPIVQLSDIQMGTMNLRYRGFNAYRVTITAKNGKKIRCFSPDPNKYVQSREPEEVTILRKRIHESQGRGGSRPAN